MPPAHIIIGLNCGPALPLANWLDILRCQNFIAYDSWD